MNYAYISSLFYALVVFLKKWAYIKIEIPWELMQQVAVWGNHKNNTLFIYGICTYIYYIIIVLVTLIYKYLRLIFANVNWKEIVNTLHTLVYTDAITDD